MSEFEGRVAVVTGGAGNIGMATARVLGERGARVLLVDVDPEVTEQAAAELRDAGVDAHAHAADVSDSGSVAGYARRAAELGEGVGLFFNNAGIEGPVQPLVDYPDDGFDRVLAVNVRGIFLGLKHVLPLMHEGGAVVNTSSVAGLQGARASSATSPRSTPFSASREPRRSRPPSAASASTRSARDP